MIIDRKKEKIRNAITYFLNNTSASGKKKIYKLLFLFDFEHYKLTGRSVTGFDYFAWQMGPVPTALDTAIDQQSEEITKDFDIEIQPTKFRHPTIYLHPKTDFEEKFFSELELDLLKGIAERFGLSTGDEMVWFTHQEHYPWYRVYEVERRLKEKIPYSYALEDLEATDKERILNIEKERQAFFETYQ